MRTGNGLIINEPGQWQRSMDGGLGEEHGRREGEMSAMWFLAAVLHMATADTHVHSLSHNWNYQQLLTEVVGRLPHHVDHQGMSSCPTHGQEVSTPTLRLTEGQTVGVDRAETKAHECDILVYRPYLHLTVWNVKKYVAFAGN